MSLKRADENSDVKSEIFPFSCRTLDGRGDDNEMSTSTCLLFIIQSDLSNVTQEIGR